MYEGAGKDRDSQPNNTIRTSSLTMSPGCKDTVIIKIITEVSDMNSLMALVYFWLHLFEHCLNRSVVGAGSRVCLLQL